MSKYIIKNCPAYSEYWAEGCNNREKTAWVCKDCTDCVMKQIVEYCRDNEKYGDEYYTNPILKLLDIQEVE